MDSVLRRLPRSRDPNLLVGFETNDDAGVYQIADDLALVQTVDFLTPIADDPFAFGQIAAANALSDIYAMGGRAVSALSIVGFPPRGDANILEQILRGGLAKMEEAGCAVVGGHSVRDEELKFGYAVTGIIPPQRIWRNSGAQPGDLVFLTKPIGTGVIATALKSAQASAESLEASLRSMTGLNREAAEALHAAENAAGAENPVHAVTDVTGFGLLGHAREIAVGSGVSLRLESARVPLLPGAREAARGGFHAGGLKSNREFLESCMEFRDSVAQDLRTLFYDPQTSGGLLIAMAPESASALASLFERHKIPAAQIGEVLPQRSPLIEVR